MNTQRYLCAILGLAAAVVLAAVTTKPALAPRDPEPPATPPVPVAVAPRELAETKFSPSPTSTPLEDARDRPPRVAADVDPSTAEALESWRQEFERLIAHMGELEARRQMALEMDQQFLTYLAPRLQEFEANGEATRTLGILELERNLRSGVSTILDSLGLPPSEAEAEFNPRNAGELLRAESQYGGMPGGQAIRVARLRLEEEREQRVIDAVLSASQGVNPRDHIQSEIEPWYEAELRRLVLGDSESPEDP